MSRGEAKLQHHREQQGRREGRYRGTRALDNALETEEDNNRAERC